MKETAIDIFSDPICPWCMIGKRRLDRALAQFESADNGQKVTVRWRIFQLNPAMPREGMDRAAYLAAKFGGAGRAREVYRVIDEEGRKEGLDFAFGRIRRTPNTLPAQALISLADGEGLASEMAGRLFAAYFTEGMDIGADGVLMELARGVGLEGDVEGALRDGPAWEALRRADTEARRAGISAVPFLVIDGRFSLSGAVAPEVILRALELSRESA